MSTTKLSFAFIFALLAFACSTDKSTTQQTDLASYVDPFIGTQGMGNMYPGATVPFGMVQLSPDNTEYGELCAGYQYDFNYIYGFSHTHLSGTGIGDLTDLLIMPTMGELVTYKPKTGNDEPGFQSEYQNANEFAEPGYYKVLLDKYQVTAELTATERVGFHKYTFQETGDAHIILDLLHLNNQSWMGPDIKKAFINVKSDQLITGGRIVKNWAPNRFFYFAAEFSQPIESYGFVINDSIVENIDSAKSKNLKAYVNFTITEKETPILVKVGISCVSEEGALKNLRAEVPEWDFESVRQEAYAKWNDQLGRINVDIPDEESRTIFYTSLYRSMLAPVLYCDVDGKYRGSDNEIHEGEHLNYHIFSLWDTFRAQHPLLTLFQADKVPDMMNSMLAIYDESGNLPVWHFGNGDNNCMLGFHALPVLSDAHLKGIEGFDAEHAINAMIHDIHGDGTLTDEEKYEYAKGTIFNRDNQIYSTKLFHQYGYIPCDMTTAASAKTQEYALNNYAIGKMAESMNMDTADYYLKMASAYKNVYDTVSGFTRGRLQDGSFKTSKLDPVAQVNGWIINGEGGSGDYVEGSAWQWLWFAPHDVSGLIEMLGGKDIFTERLDTFFDPEYEGEESEEAAGYYGQYAQGNEPDHHVPYLYNYVGESWKTQKVVREIMKRTYHTGPDGLSGNDDCGQMSAWYVFSSLGFYPVNPVGGVYAFGSPVIKSANIQVSENTFFEIEVENYAVENIYIQSVSLNGEEYNKSWIHHSDIMKGGKLVFVMGSEPNKEFAALPENYPID